MVSLRAKGCGRFLTDLRGNTEGDELEINIANEFPRNRLILYTQGRATSEKMCIPTEKVPVNTFLWLFWWMNGRLLPAKS